MSAGAFLNICRFTANAGGTVDFVVSSAVTGYQAPASAGAVNATVYSYRAESSDLSEWEIGEGAYTSGSTTLARTTVHKSSNAGAKVNFSAAPQVAITALAGDLLVKANNLSDVANAATAFANIKQAATASATGVVKRQRMAVLRDEKATNTEGGTFSSGAWRTRTLNTEEDPDGIVTLSSNQFTLPAGTYKVSWSAPAGAVDIHQSRLQNITDGATVAYAGQGYAQSASPQQLNTSVGAAIFTIAGSKAFEIQHQCQTTKTNNGFGFAINLSSSTEVYTIVEIISYDQ